VSYHTRQAGPFNIGCPTLPSSHILRRLSGAERERHDTTAQVQLTIRIRHFDAQSQVPCSEETFFVQRQRRLFTESGSILATITSRFYWFRAKYDFELSSGEIYHFRSTKLWKPTFTCESQAGCFVLYQHKGLHFSVFQNDRQIAAFKKKRLKLANGDRYAIRINTDANIVVVLCLALAVDVMDYDENEFAMAVDFGNIGPEAKPLNESWEPE